MSNETESIERALREKQLQRRADYNGILSPDLTQLGTVGGELEQQPMPKKEAYIATGLGLQSEVLAYIEHHFPEKLTCSGIRFALEPSYPNREPTAWNNALSSLERSNRIRRIDKGVYQGLPVRERPPPPRPRRPHPGALLAPVNEYRISTDLNEIQSLPIQTRPANELDPVEVIDRCTAALADLRKVAENMREQQAALDSVRKAFAVIKF